MITIDVVIPTVPGRAKWLAKAVSSYRSNSVYAVRVHVVRGAKTVGIAWNQGIRELIRHGRGDCLHLSADDVEARPGWDQAAVGAVEMGTYPSPLQLNGDGEPVIWGNSQRPIADGAPVNQSPFPFMPWGLADKITPGLDVHYYADDWFGYQAKQNGYQPTFVEDYRLVHHFVRVGRAWTEPEDVRMTKDRRAFEAAVERGHA